MLVRKDLYVIKARVREICGNNLFCCGINCVVFVGTIVLDESFPESRFVPKNRQIMTFKGVVAPNADDQGVTNVVGETASNAVDMLVERRLAMLLANAATNAVGDESSSNDGMPPAVVSSSDEAYNAAGDATSSSESSSMPDMTTLVLRGTMRCSAW